jgi:Tol biopolymer transport system component
VSLTGQLIFLTSSVDGQKLMELDLGSGVQTTLFAAPDYSWLSDGAVSPDGRQIAMTYIPAPAAGEKAFASPGLYVMPLGGAGSPSPLLLPADRNEAFSTPAWSPDSKYIYYSRVVYHTDNGGVEYTIERAAYPGGQREVLIQDGLWPSLSPDGSKLAYLSLDPATLSTTLSLADADGKNPAPVLPPDAFPIVDSHFFTPDGGQIIFSAPGEKPQTKGSFLEQLLGVRTASAHSIPSDWWRVPTSGGQAERLTQIYGTGLYGGFAPDGRHIAFIDATGVYIMNPDGSEIRQLLGTPASGIVAWVNELH